MTNVTTDYAALFYGSTGDNSRYVRIDGRIVGAVTRRYGGDGLARWSAWTVDQLDAMTTPLADDLPNRDAAVATVLAVTRRTEEIAFETGASIEEATERAQFEQAHNLLSRSETATTEPEGI